jgi:hypothetical protein
MRTTWKLLIAVSAVVMMVGATTVGWAAGSSRGPGAQPDLAHPAAARPTALIDTSTEAKYTAITPCRIVDTRGGSGKLQPGVTRVFQVAGTSNFPAQGGNSGGCGVPTSATAVAATVVAVNEAGPGFLVTWPTGSPQSNSSFMNYANTNLVSSGAQIPINTSINLLAGVSSTDVVIDVDGYYIKPMFAEVNAVGVAVSSSRVTGITHLSTGRYQVDFDRDVTACSYQVTSFFGPYTVLTQPRTLDPTGVFVEIINSALANIDSQFYLTVTC